MTEADMKREDGFYWVCYEGHWEPAQWFEGRWFIIHSLAEHRTEWFDVIGPQIKDGPDALDALKREVAERVRGMCADAAHHERADGSACCQTEEIIRGLDLPALLAEARHE